MAPQKWTIFGPVLCLNDSSPRWWWIAVWICSPLHYLFRGSSVISCWKCGPKSSRCAGTTESQRKLQGLQKELLCSLSDHKEGGGAFISHQFFLCVWVFCDKNLMREMQSNFWLPSLFCGNWKMTASVKKFLYSEALVVSCFFAFFFGEQSFLEFQWNMVQEFSFKGMDIGNTKCIRNWNSFSIRTKKFFLWEPHFNTENAGCRSF